jgi:hypothetical protein
VGERWYAGVPPVRVTVDWGEWRHTILWKRGALVLADHPDPVEDAVLVALVGERCPCYDVLDTWRSARDVRRRSDPLHEWQGGDSLALASLRELRRIRAGRWSKFELFRMTRARLPRELSERMAITEAVRQHRARDPAVAPAVIVRAVAALRQAVHGWRRHHADRDDDVGVEAWTVEPGEPPMIAGLLDAGGGQVRVGVPVPWLWTVWARGLAVVDGCFVLDAAPLPGGSGNRYGVTAVRWERLTPDGLTPVPSGAVAVRGPGPT